MAKAQKTPAEFPISLAWEKKKRNSELTEENELRTNIARRKPWNKPTLCQ